jgi:uncharacterized protein (DUF1800 family)
MILNRRSFNASALAALVANGISLPASAVGSAKFDRVALNRLTFGANQKTSLEFSKLGLEAWLDFELAKPGLETELQKKLAAATLMIEYDADKDDKNRSWPARKEKIAYQYLDADGAKLLPLLDFDKLGMSYEERIRPGREVQAASLIRAVHADAQLREVMTQFWHDHFNVNSQRDEHTAAFFGHYDKMLRENALGNFRQMLGEVARAPAMLFYLNNEASRASPANENFARELFELHTLGAGNYFNDRTTEWHKVPGAEKGLAEGYIDQDVYEAARALTGWSFGDGRWLAEGDYAPSTGEFYYIDRWHDPYQKRILGVEFRANAGPMADGEKLMDILAHHPGTTKFLCTKLCRRLLADEPPAALLEHVAAVWLKHINAPDQLAQVVRAIVLSSEFKNQAPAKLKRPFEFLASLYRAVEADVASPSLNYIWELSKAGWNQHEFRPPTGHPDKAEYWANTNLISGFVNMSLNALEDWMEAGRVNLAASLGPDVSKNGEAFQYLSARLSGVSVPQDAVKEMLLAMGVDPEASLPPDKGDRESLLRGFVATAALQPQFLFR